MNNEAKSILVKTGFRILNRTLFVAAFGVVAVTRPIEMDFVEPDHGAAQVQQAETRMDRLTEKCESVPSGEFPTSAIVEYKSGKTVLSTAPGMANYLFKVAVGESPLNPSISKFTLCK